MFMPPSSHEDDEFRGAGLSNLEYAPLAEEMGHIGWASEVFNCSAPDTGNMEVFMRYGTKEQKRKVAAAADGRRNPLGLPDDRAGGGVVGCHQHRDPHRDAMAIITSSTAANGGRRASAIPAARSRS